MRTTEKESQVGKSLVVNSPLGTMKIKNHITNSACGRHSKLATSPAVVARKVNVTGPRPTIDWLCGG